MTSNKEKYILDRAGSPGPGSELRRNSISPGPRSINGESENVNQRLPNVFGSVFNRILSESPTPIFTELQLSINGTDYSRYLINRNNRNNNLQNDTVVQNDTNL